MSQSELHRRDMFKGLLALSTMAALPACGSSQNSSKDREATSHSSGFFDANEMVLLSALAQTIIPKTDTAGAIEAGVPETLQSLATDWGDDKFRKYARSGLRRLNNALQQGSSQSFDQLSLNERGAVLAAYDSQVFEGEIEDGFYRDLKATVVQAYYTSEPGATEELAYEPIPGEWIGCVSLSDYPKTWAT